MCRTLLVAAFAFVVSVLGLGANAIAADRCEQVQAEFHTAETSGQVAVMEAMLPEIQAACRDVKIRFCAGNSVALMYADLARVQAERGAPLEDLKATLLRGREQGSPWPVLFMLGDIALELAIERENSDESNEAGSVLQQALNAINEPSVCDPNDPGPGREQIEFLYGRIYMAQALGSEFKVERTKNGCGGLFLSNVKGVTPTERPIPINFVFAEDAFTPAGEGAAAALLECLKERRLSEIILTGHTDDKGDEAFNMALSKRRLDRVAAYLRAGGIDSEFVLIPKGESEPFLLDDPSRYTEEQVDLFNRRVVLVEDGRGK